MKVACYARVSSQQQAQQQTIEQQLARLRTYCQSQNWPWCEDLLFRDDGYSGASLKRPGLERLRDQVGQAEVEIVLITAPDRLTRNYVHQVLLLEELQRHGCEVHFVEHPMSQDAHDQLLLQIRGAVAEYERTLIAERLRRGRQHKFQAGLLLPWSRPLYGYRLSPDQPRDPRGVRLEESEAVQVSAIFAAYLQEGQTLRHLAQQLMAQGIPTPSGKLRWNTSSLRNILTNPAYTGTLYAGRTHAVQPRRRRSALQPVGQRTCNHATPPEDWILVGHIPPIVSAMQFEQVQAKLAHNQACATRHNNRQPYLLRALVSCGRCGHACAGRAQGRYIYYACQGTQHPVASRQDERCSARLIPAQQLDELVWRDLCALLQHPELLTIALQQAQGGAWLPQEWQARRQQIRQSTTSLQQQEERLTEAYLAGVLSLEEYRRRRQDLAQRLAAIEQQAHLLEIQLEQQRDVTALATSITAFCQRVQVGLEQATFEQRRLLVELLIDRVVVTAEEVEIRYVIPTSPRSEHLRFCHLRLDYFVALVADVVCIEWVLLTLDRNI